MKLIVGIIYTRDMPKLSDALEAMGLIVHEIAYDGRRAVQYRVFEGVAYICRLLNRVKIRTIISDELVGMMMETLHGFGNCKFVIIPEEQICLA
jgi:nitrogen regulatory protein PII